MNYDIPLRYLARVWFSQPPKVSTAQALTRLASLLEAELELVSMMRLDVNTGVGGPTSAWIDKDAGWQLIASSESIDLELHGAPGISLQPFSAFLATAAEVFTFVASLSKVAAHRVASVAEGFLPEMAESKLNDIAARVLRFPSSFEPAPYEWDWRCVQRTPRVFGGLSENMNTLATVRRMSGQMVSKGTQLHFDRIRVDLDINTHGADTKARFNADKIQAYYTSAASWHEQFSREMSLFLGLGGQE